MLTNVLSSSDLGGRLCVILPLGNFLCCCCLSFCCDSPADAFVHDKEKASLVFVSEEHYTALASPALCLRANRKGKSLRKVCAALILLNHETILFPSLLARKTAEEPHRTQAHKAIANSVHDIRTIVTCPILSTTSEHYEILCLGHVFELSKRIVWTFDVIVPAPK